MILILPLRIFTFSRLITFIYPVVSVPYFQIISLLPFSHITWFHLRISSNSLSCFLQVLTLFSIRPFQYGCFLLFPLFCLVLTPSISATRKAALANNLLSSDSEFVSTLVVTLFTCSTLLAHSFYIICLKCCYTSNLTFPQNLIFVMAPFGYSFA